MISDSVVELQLAGLRLWLRWWSGFYEGAESVLGKRLAKQLLLAV
jgi:hypothetical protein